MKLHIGHFEWIHFLSLETFEMSSIRTISMHAIVVSRGWNIIHSVLSQGCDFTPTMGQISISEVGLDWALILLVLQIY